MKKNRFADKSIDEGIDNCVKPCPNDPRPDFWPSFEVNLGRTPLVKLRDNTSYLVVRKTEAAKILPHLGNIS